ncbi:MAG: hypothetical protein HN929_12895, partial [Chloroflexi bacterium]|nr:hypothetical protein [Chloroflexota bacterium]
VVVLALVVLVGLVVVEQRVGNFMWMERQTQVGVGVGLTDLMILAMEQMAVQE